MRPRTCTSPLHRLAALSKKRLAGGSFPFSFRLTDLSTELRWWCPICLCTFKGAQPHTRSALIQADTCMRNKLNQMSVLQTSLRTPQPPSVTTSTQIFSRPATSNPPCLLMSFFILFVVLRAPVVASQSTLPEGTSSRWPSRTSTTQTKRGGIAMSEPSQQAANLIKTSTAT